MMDYDESLEYDQYDYINQTSNMTSSDHVTSTYEHVIRVISQVILPLIFSLISVLGLIGNLLVIAVVLANSRMRTTTNALIINLAVADLLFIVFCVPFTAVSLVVKVWPFGVWFCKIYGYTINVTVYISVYTLVLMALDRYLAVVHPITSLEYRTERNACLVIIGLWVVICLLNIPAWLQHTLQYYHVLDRGTEYQKTNCINTYLYAQSNKHLMKERSQVFYVCFFTFAYALPLALVSVLYALMLRSLPQSTSLGRAAVEDRIKTNKRITRMIIVVVLVFAFCWLPWNLHNLVFYWYFLDPDRPDDFTSDHAALYLWKIISQCFAYMNSCVNPFLYAFLSENFRKSFARVLCGGKYRETSEGIEPKILCCASSRRHNEVNIGLDEFRHDDFMHTQSVCASAQSTVLPLQPRRPEGSHALRNTAEGNHALRCMAEERIEDVVLTL